MNFSQHSSYGERNVPLHGPSPRAQANGVSRAWRPADLPQHPCSSPRDFYANAEARMPPPPTSSPVPKFADAHTAAEAEADLRHHRHEPRQFLVCTKCCRFLTALDSGDAQYVKKMPRTAVHPRAGSCTGRYTSRVFSGAAAEVLWVAGGVCRRCRWGRG